MPRSPLRIFYLLVVLAGLQSSCATAPADHDATQAVTRESASEYGDTLIPVARYGRYTLVELVPEPAQRDLLEQVIDVSIPSAPQVSVGDALRHVLLRSGYQLCDAADAAALYALPLPAAHSHLGPLTVRDALLTLAGPSWQLSVDEQSRQVCFRPQGPSIAPDIRTAVIASAPVLPVPESRIESPSASTVRPAEIGATAAIPKRPFRVLGVELRGGDRLLSVIHKADGSLTATQFLREGEALGDWRLILIDIRTALFDVNGLQVRVALP